MAAKRAKAKTSSQTTTKVTRISASDSSPKKTSSKKTAQRVKTTEPSTSSASPINTASDGDPLAKRRSPLKATKDYFVGAWHELREVRWPTRRTTWGMTGALLAFTTFFVVVILLLDAGFQYVFKLLIGQ